MKKVKLWAARLRVLMAIVAVLCADLAFASPASAAGTFQSSWTVSNSTPSNANTTYNWSYYPASTANLVRETFSVPAGTDGPSGQRYMILNGVDGNFATTPSTSTNETNGTLDIRVKLAMDNWYPGTVKVLMDKGSWRLTVNSANAFELAQQDAGGFVFPGSYVPAGWANGSTHWVRVTKDTTTTSFYVSNDGINWTLNDTRGAKATLSANNSALAIGAYSIGAAATAGKFYYASVGNTINGTTNDPSSCAAAGLASCFDPNAASPTSPGAWTSTIAGEAWAINRSGTNEPADLGGDLTVTNVTGLPSSGTAQLRMIDSVVKYTHNVAAITGGTSVSVSIGGIRNTPTTSVHRSLISDYSTGSPPPLRESGTTSNAVAFGLVAGSPTYSVSSSVSGGAASHTIGMTTSNAASLSSASFTVPAGTNATGTASLYLPGSSQNFALTPTNTGNNITGDIDIRVNAKLDQWNNGTYQTFVGKRSTGLSYQFRMKGMGTKVPELIWSTDGSTGPACAGADVPFADGSPGWLRATLDVDNGAGGYGAAIYTSTDGTSWTLNASCTGGAPTSIYSTGNNVEIGSALNGSQFSKGNIYYADVRNVLSGTSTSTSNCAQASVVVCFNPNLATGAPFHSWSSSIGESWSIARGGQAETAAIEKVLSVGAVSGFPSGGSASLSLSDNVVNYRFAAAPVVANAAASLTVGGLTNTATPGSFASSITTFDANKLAIDSAKTNAVTFGPLTPTWTNSRSIASALDTGYTWSTTTQAANTISRVAATAPNSNNGNERYLSLAGSVGQYATTPDSAANRLTGNLTIETKVAMANWTPITQQFLVSKIANTNKSYGLGLDSNNGKLLFIRSTDGESAVTGYLSSVPTGFAANSAHWLRVVFTLDNGTNSVATFSTSEDGTNWTQLGTPSASSDRTPTYAGTTAIELGGRTSGTGLNPDAKIYSATIRDAANAVVNNFRPGDSSFGAQSWGSTSSPQGEMWSVVRGPQGTKADISSDLAVATLTGLPPGGRAELRTIEGTASYRPPSPTVVAANSLLTVGLKPFTNPSAGTYGSTFSTYDNATVAGVVDSGPANTNTFGNTPTTWTTDKRGAGATDATYNWSMSTRSTNTVSKLAAVVPAGTAAGERYLSAGTASNGCAATPDTPANSPTAEIDLRAKVMLDDWTPSSPHSLISKYWNGVGEASYSLRLASDGRLGFAKYSTGSGYDSGFSPGFNDRETGWVRVTFKADNGANAHEEKFYKSLDGVNWTLLGTNTVPGTYFLKDSNTALGAGCEPAGFGSIRGKLYVAQVRSSIDGPVVAQMSPVDAPLVNPASWTSSSPAGETWSLQRWAPGIPPDIASDLTVISVSGVPTGGTAQLRYVDQVAQYLLPAPTTVANNAAVQLSLKGIKNVGPQGTYTTTFATYDNSTTPTPIDSGPSAGLYLSTPPNAVADSATTNQDSSVVIPVLANDTDADDTIVASATSVPTAPPNGTTSVNSSNGAVTYTPSPGFYGMDTFQYSVCDTYGACSLGTITVTVNPNNLSSAKWSVVPAATGHTNLREQFVFVPRFTVTSSKATFTMPTGFAASPVVVESYGVAGTVTSSFSSGVLTLSYPPQPLVANTPVAVAVEGITNGGAAGSFAPAVNLFDTAGTTSIGWLGAPAVTLTSGGVPTNGAAGFGSLWKRSLSTVSTVAAQVSVSPLQTSDANSSFTLTSAGTINANTSSFGSTVATSSGRTLTAITPDSSTSVTSAAFAINRWGLQVTSSTGAATASAGPGVYVGLATTPASLFNNLSATNVLTVNTRARINYLQPAGQYRSTLTWRTAGGV